MSRVTEIARLLHCTESNVCRLLREGKIQGTRTAYRWVVSEQAVQEYLDRPKPKFHPIKNKLYKGQKFGYWTVLDPESRKNKNEKRTALV